jgi:hypothetical protein
MIYLKSVLAGLGSFILGFAVCGFVRALWTISSNRATGLGAVAGGFMEYTLSIGWLMFLAGFIWEYRRASHFSRQTPTIR